MLVMLIFCVCVLRLITQMRQKIAELKFNSTLLPSLPLSEVHVFNLKRLKQKTKNRKKSGVRHLNLYLSCHKTQVTLYSFSWSSSVGTGIIHLYDFLVSPFKVPGKSIELQQAAGHRKRGCGWVGYTYCAMHRCLQAGHASISWCERHRSKLGAGWSGRWGSAPAV